MIHASYLSTISNTLISNKSISNTLVSSYLITKAPKPKINHKWKKKIVLLLKIQTLTNGLLGYNDNFLQFITLFNWLIINKVLDTEFSWGLVAQWITRLTTDQKIPGSNPGELVLLYIKHVFFYVAFNCTWNDTLKSKRRVTLNFTMT